MGLFDKLFGGKRPEADASSPGTPSPASPSPTGPVPARRERSKPTDGSKADAANPFSDASPLGPGLSAGERLEAPGDLAHDLPPLPMDGENAELLAAINGVIASDNAETRGVLYATMLKSELLLVSLDKSLPVGQVQLQEGHQLQLATIKGPDGNVYLPAFTDVERLSRTLPGEGARFIRIPVPAICRMFLQGGGEGIVINPSMPPSGMISRGEAEILATDNVPTLGEDGKIVGEAQQPVRIGIGKPQTPPAPSFIDAIRAKASELPQVREVHLFSAGIEGQPPRLMIGLLLDDELTPEQMHPNFEAIGKAAFDAKGETEAFDMMPLNSQMIEAIRQVEGIVYSRDQQV